LINNKNQGEFKMKSQDYIQKEDKFGAHNYKPLDVVLSKGEGVWGVL